MTPLDDEEQFRSLLIQRLARLYACVDVATITHTVRAEYGRFTNLTDPCFVHVLVEQSSKIILAELNLARLGVATRT